MLKNVETFKNFKPDSGRVILMCRGYIGKMFGIGANRQVNGIFILTDEKLHFFKKGLIRNVHYEWALDSIVDFSFRKEIISTRIVFSGDNDFLNMHLSSSWRVCEDFLQTTWKMILDCQTKNANSRDRDIYNNASRRVTHLLRIHSNLPMDEILTLSQDQAWTALRKNAPEWYKKEDAVYLFGFDAEGA